MNKQILGVLLIAAALIAYRFASPFTPFWVDMLAILLCLLVLVVWGAGGKKEDKEGDKRE